MKKSRLLTLVIFLATIIYGLFSNKGLVTKNVKKGIEFSGGIEILSQVKSNTSSKIDMEGIANTIAKRIDAAGVKNPQIDIEQGIDNSGKSVQKIRTTIAGVQDSEIKPLTELITSQGLISFRDTDDNFLAKGTDFLVPNGASLAFQDGKPIVSLQVAKKEVIREMSNSIKYMPEGKNKMVIWVDFDPETDSYAKYEQYIRSGQCYTSKDIEIIKTCNKVISAASVNSELNGDIIISGGFTPESARQLASYINSGSFEYKLKVEEINSVVGAYGQQAFQRAINASKIAIVAVSAFMFFIYGLGGLFSILSLIIYLFAVLSTFNWLGGEYGPDTIAALIIGFGMAADASIILFERFKDELLKGRDIELSFDQSNKKSLSSIIDSNITTFIVAFILFQFGSRTVKGFSIMLSISIFWTAVIIVGITRFNLNMIIKSGIMENKKHWFGVKKKHIPKSVQREATYKGLWNKIDFIGKAKKLIAISLMVIGLGLTVAGSKGTNNSIQFTGGTRVSTHTTIDFGQEKEIVNIQKDIASIISSTGAKISEKEIRLGKNNDKKYTITFNTKNDIANNWQDVKSKLEAKYPDYKFSSSIVSSNVAKNTFYNAMKSIGWAIIAIIIYISVRFKWSYSIAAIIALVHDSLLVYALFAIFGLEVNVAFISAILAIIGYSINDTIVSFDRIRENMNSRPRSDLQIADLKIIANKATRQTVTRSLFTSITTLIAIFTLIVFGSKASLLFNTAMFIGLVAGTYSSIWVASYCWVILENIRIKRLKAAVYKPLPKIDGEPDENVFPGVND